MARCPRYFGSAGWSAVSVSSSFKALNSCGSAGHDSRARMMQSWEGFGNELQAFLQVKSLTYALEVGAGFSPVRFLDVDLRYAVPVGGVVR